MHKIGETVTIEGKIKEIIISEKETTYKLRIYESAVDAPSLIYNEVIVREEDAKIKIN